MNGKKLKGSTFLLTLLFGFFFTNSMVFADTYDTDDYLKIAEEIVNWKQQKENSDVIFSTPLLTNAGNQSSDWFAVGVSRIGLKANYLEYQALLSKNVVDRYQEKNKLSPSKATEWHRIALTTLAVGGNPKNVFFDKDTDIDLIRDGVFNREKDQSLNRQGINGLIFALITIDSMNYASPDKANVSREEILKQLIENQNEDGGFALNSNIESDIDITAMAVTSLAPYYNSEETFSIKNKEVSVKETIESSLTFLSKKQEKDGGFKSWGAANSESASQVILALTSLGIDPQIDSRFIKNDNSVVDYLLTFRQNDGGFIHSFEYDKDNPTSKPDESNTMASEQALIALGALIRDKENMRHIYDFREEISSTEKEKIDNVSKKIGNLSIENTSKEETKSIYNEYNEIPIENKRYIKKYSVLSELLDKHQLETSDSDFSSTNIGEASDGDGVITLIPEKKLYEPTINLEKNLKTIDRLDKNRLKLSDSVLINSTYYQQVKENKTPSKDLAVKNQEIGDLRQKLFTLSQKIKDDFYPFNELGATDYFKVRSVMKEINQISPEDRKYIYGYEDMDKTYAQVNSLFKKVVISIIIIILVLVSLTILIKRRRARKQAKLEQMMMFDEEDEE